MHNTQTQVAFQVETLSTTGNFDHALLYFNLDGNIKVVANVETLLGMSTTDFAPRLKRRKTK